MINRLFRSLDAAPRARNKPLSAPLPAYLRKTIAFLNQQDLCHKLRIEERPVAREVHS
jgi:hypothetical protein